MDYEVASESDVEVGQYYFDTDAIYDAGQAAGGGGGPNGGGGGVGI
jgi:hypothetical protein